MILISGIARANGGLIKLISGSVTAERPRIEQAVPPTALAVQAIYRDSVEVDSCERVLFALSGDNGANELTFALETPAGDIISPDSHPGNVEVISSPNLPYLGLRIHNPPPGLWNIAVAPVKLADIIATFQFIVTAENLRFSGGLTSTKQSYNPGEIIRLQLQINHLTAITGYEVSGIAIHRNGTTKIAIEFRDDEQKDPRAGRPGNGIFTGSLPGDLESGVYMIEVTADNMAKKATYAEPADNFPEIPAFLHKFIHSVVMGEEPIQRLTTEPSEGYPGGNTQTTVTGNFTHFQPIKSAFDFGAGITVNDVQIKDRLTALVTLSIGRAAPLGPRTITATTGKEIVKTEEGFQVVRYKWVWSDNCIIRLLIFIIILLIIVLLIMAILLLQGP